MTKTNKIKIDFRRLPWRGVFKSVADKLNDGTSRQQVRRGYFSKNLRMMQLVDDEIESILKTMKRNDKITETIKKTA